QAGHAAHLPAAPADSDVEPQDLPQPAVAWRRWRGKQVADGHQPFGAHGRFYGTPLAWRARALTSLSPSAAFAPSLSIACRTPVVVPSDSTQLSRTRPCVRRPGGVTCSSIGVSRPLSPPAPARPAPSVATSA